LFLDQPIVQLFNEGDQMENNQSKLLTPLMLASALVTISSSATAYDHSTQSSVFSDKTVFATPYDQMRQTTHTQTVNPSTGMIYNDQD
jgi:hypothetical protein